MDNEQNAEYLHNLLFTEVCDEEGMDDDDRINALEELRMVYNLDAERSDTFGKVCTAIDESFKLPCEVYDFLFDHGLV